jgi:hypothetical protein
VTQKDLRSFPAHTVHPDRVLYRIHLKVRDPVHFSSSGHGRFDLRPETGAGTCYCASSELGAFVETFGRFQFLTQQVIDERALSSLALLRTMKLADLTDRSILGSFGIAGDLSTGPDYGPSQDRAQRFYEAGFDGIFYAARYDPAFTERSVAMFGNQETGSKLFDVVTEPIPMELVDAASDQFGFTVSPSGPLL